MEINGLVYKILPVQSGTSARGEWQKREIIVEMPEEFNRKVCVTFFGDKAADAANLREGDKVSISINIESREYNGRWYTNVNAWRINPTTAAAPATPVAPTVEEAPFKEPAMPASADDVDDLPF
ncbi:MAG: DUF3127 domain-containing protein [Rikenellaceae bacterium]|nr:DUF3127 domain-containing protein [Rikenellaceae bacterium]